MSVSSACLATAERSGCRAQTSPKQDFSSVAKCFPIWQILESIATRRWPASAVNTNVHPAVTVAGRPRCWILFGTISGRSFPLRNTWNMPKKYVAACICIMAVAWVCPSAHPSIVKVYTVSDISPFMVLIGSTRKAEYVTDFHCSFMETNKFKKMLGSSCTSKLWCENESTSSWTFHLW